MKSKAAEILNNLYGLITDINYNKPDEDVLSDLKEKPEPFVEEQLMRVKRSIAKHKAEAHRVSISLAWNEFLKLKEKGVEELQKILTPAEQLEYAKLFRKFDGLTKEDEDSILEDKQLLKLLERIKDQPNDQQS